MGQSYHTNEAVDGEVPEALSHRLVGALTPHCSVGYTMPSVSASRGDAPKYGRQYRASHRDASLSPLHTPHCECGVKAPDGVYVPLGHAASPCYK